MTVLMLFCSFCYNYNATSQHFRLFLTDLTSIPTDFNNGCLDASGV